MKPENTKRAVRQASDPENTEWTREEFARAVTFDKLPSRLRQKISSRKRGGRRRFPRRFRSRFVYRRRWWLHFALPAQGGRHGSTIFCGSTSRREREADQPFRFPPFCWIMKEVVRGLTAPLSVGKFRIGSRGQKPCVAACHTTRCLPAEVAGHDRSNKQCAK
jgi:hypothetical protein